MTGAEFMAVAGFVIVLFGALFGVWKYLDSKLSSIRTTAETKADAASGLASLTRQELADHKLHVAEHYVSKQGHREATEQIMDAIGSVKASIDGTNQRIDRLWEERSKPAPRRS